MWAHMIAGAMVIAMFLFHELFLWFAGSAVWYAVSLVAMYDFMSERRGFRWLLALMFLLGAIAGLIFINRVFPTIQPPGGPLIPHSMLPIWVGAANLAYFCGTLLLLFSRKIRRAASVGFTLW